MHYFKRASEASGDLHKLYKPSAVLSFGTDGPAVTGLAPIKDKLEKLRGARFSVLPETGGSFKFQPTPDAGVLIMVSGEVWLQDQVTKQHSPVPMRFVHTALLVREQDSKFFISNDMHQFFNEDKLVTMVSDKVEEPKPVENAVVVMPAMVEEEKKKEEPVEKVAATVVEEKKEEQLVAPAKTEEKPKQARVRAAKPPAVAPEPAVVAAPVAAPKGPMSYSVAVSTKPQVAAPVAVPAVAPVAATTTAAPVAVSAKPKPATHAPSTAAPAPSTTAPAPSTVAAAVPVPHASSSILVKFDPKVGLSPLAISAAFKPFGVPKAAHTMQAGVTKLIFASKEAAAILAHNEPIKAEGHLLQVEASSFSSTSKSSSFKPASKRKPASSTAGGGEKPAFDKPARTTPAAVVPNA
ncbi:hypothetical protein BASA81_004207 [Batrachochytrium salamandrivorans]|nr:hypothetical protein BASA81_004207 [Batrachochytrium salamandrivorans]